MTINHRSKKRFSTNQKSQLISFVALSSVALIGSLAFAPSFAQELPKTNDVASTGALPPVTPPPPPPPAPSGPVAWSGPTFGDLEKLRSENAMLGEQLKNAELKNKIAGQGGSNTFSPNGNNQNSANSGGVSKLPSGPRVVMIAGGENNYRANILLSNGQSITASVGSSVPGYGPVSAITSSEVLFGVGKSKRSIALVTNGADSDFVMKP